MYRVVKMARYSVVRAEIHRNFANFASEDLFGGGAMRGTFNPNIGMSVEMNRSHATVGMISAIRAFKEVVLLMGGDFSDRGGSAPYVRAGRLR